MSKEFTTAQFDIVYVISTAAHCEHIAPRMIYVTAATASTISATIGNTADKYLVSANINSAKPYLTDTISPELSFGA